MPTPTLSTTHRPNLLTLGAQQMLRQVIALQLTADVQGRPPGGPWVLPIETKKFLRESGGVGVVDYGFTWFNRGDKYIYIYIYK